MSRFTPWNNHPRACVLRVGVDYDQTVTSQRERASMAAIFANVWIFNAATKSRKEVNFVGPLPRKSFTISDVQITISGPDGKSEPFKYPPAVPIWHCSPKTAVDMTNIDPSKPYGVCGACNRFSNGSPVVFRQNLGPDETRQQSFYCTDCLNKRVIK